MKIYAHNREAILHAEKPVATLLQYPSGNNHVLLTTGQQVRRTPKDRSESGKARRKREKIARRYTRSVAAANTQA